MDFSLVLPLYCPFSIGSYDATPMHIWFLDSPLYSFPSGRFSMSPFLTFMKVSSIQTLPSSITLSWMPSITKNSFFTQYFVVVEAFLLTFDVRLKLEYPKMSSKKHTHSEMGSFRLSNIVLVITVNRLPHDLHL